MHVDLGCTRITCWLMVYEAATIPVHKSLLLVYKARYRNGVEKRVNMKNHKLSLQICTEAGYHHHQHARLRNLQNAFRQSS